MSRKIRVEQADIDKIKTLVFRAEFYHGFNEEAYQTVQNKRLELMKSLKPKYFIDEYETISRTDLVGNFFVVEN